MFKGYVPMKGKRPTESVKGRTEFYNLGEVEHLLEYGGVLKDEIIMIDIDNKEQSKILDKILKDFNIKCNRLKTSRGMHFYFKNTDVTTNCIAKFTAIGLIADVKLGNKNAVVPLKLNGEEREFDKLENIDYLPKWLNIIPLCPDFNNLKEGDGRNQTFFNYILKLQRATFTKEEIKETIRIINKYVMNDPLSENELNVILRDDSFSKPNFFGGQNGTTLLHDKFAEYLRNEEKIIKIAGQLNIYHEGVYVENTNEIEKRMIKYIPFLTKSKRAEILAYLDLISPEMQLSPPTHIVVANGLLRIDNLELEEFTPDYICKNKIPVCYNPNAKSEVTDKTLNKIACKDANLRRLIEEMIGYTLFRRNELGKSFILTGEGANGKSTVLDCIKNMIGSHNVASISLNELGQRFKTAELYGKMANIGDDISNSYIEDNSLFKKLVTGETVNVERKGKDPFDFDNYSKLIFSANEIPRINDTSNGLMRRLIIVPFNAKFSPKDPDFDPYVKDKLMTTEATEYLLLLGIQGLKRILANRKFTEVSSVEDELKEYEKVNNPVIAFLEEFKVENEPTNAVYLKYTTWCIDNGLKKLSKIQFVREICKNGYQSKAKKIEGKTIKVFIKTEVTI